MAIGRLRQLSNSTVLKCVLTGFTLMFLVGAVCAPDRNELFAGLMRILGRSAVLTKDYFFLEIGSISGACMNAFLVGAVCCMLMALPGARATGTTVSAYFLTVGFCFYGMNFLNVLPFILGVFIYSKLERVPFPNYINVAMFSTALGPLASEMLLCYPGIEERPITLLAVALYLGIGILVGLCMPVLCNHSRGFHLGYNLYNAGPAAGFLGMLLNAILYKTLGLEGPPIEATLGTGDFTFVGIFCLICFLACIAFGIYLNDGRLKGYGRLFLDSGYEVDFAERYGIGPCVINFGVYGFFIVAYYILIGARFTGPTFGAVWCMMAFCAGGATPLNVFPIMVGYFVGSLFGVFRVSDQVMVVGLCFASGLAPVSGRFGIPSGILAGTLHYCLVTSVPAMHGGFNLYNGGFTAGLVCFVLIPVLQRFLKTKEERKLARVGGAPPPEDETLSVESDIAVGDE